MANMPQKSSKPHDHISNFSQKCNLLSQYLKERRTFGDISLGINGKAPQVKGPAETSGCPATTLNLLANMEHSSDQIRQKAVASASMMKSMDFFPQLVGLGPPNSTEDIINKADDRLRKPSTMDPGTAQMTIFYGGKVSVINDFPADKAEEIMALANRGSCMSTNGFSSAPTIKKVNSNNSVVAALDCNTNAQERLQLQSQAPPNGSDVPHARRASLHRFFSKRKDRVAERAPYQINNQTQGHPRPPRPEEGSNPLLALDEGQSSEQLELKL